MPLPKLSNGTLFFVIFRLNKHKRSTPSQLEAHTSQSQLTCPPHPLQSRQSVIVGKITSIDLTFMIEV